MKLHKGENKMIVKTEEYIIVVTTHDNGEKIASIVDEQGHVVKVFTQWEL